MDHYKACTRFLNNEAKSYYRSTSDCFHVPSIVSEYEPAQVDLMKADLTSSIVFLLVTTYCLYMFYINTFNQEIFLRLKIISM